MIAEQLVALRRAEPFKPFRLLTNDGRSLAVEFGCYLAISPDRKKLVYAKPEGGFEIIAVNNISEVVVDERIRTEWRRPA
jgi:hypothetical protein